MRFAAWLLAIAPIATTSACLASGEGDDDGEGAFSISVSAADTALVLDLVNYPRTDAATLDGPAGLDARAAAAIVAYRDGGDRLAISPDDNLFDSLAELDAVKYVGDSALTKLIAYAQAHPAPATVTVETVTFSGWEAEAVVWGASHATAAELDDFLDSRAAIALAGRAPYTTIAQVAAVAYVGPSALRLLQAHAPAWWRALSGSTECAPAVSDRADATVSDLTSLLELATTGDWPWATLSAPTLPACVDAHVSSSQAGAVTAALAAYGRTAWGSGITPGSTGLVAGGQHFINLLQTAQDVIRDRVDSGRWTPGNADEQAVLDALPAMVTILTAGPVANPGDYVELPLSTDADECSEFGSILIQVSTGRGWMIHQFPRC